MGALTRFGISIDDSLLERFDGLIAAKGYENRSEAIRDLIRSSLVDDRADEGCDEMVGTVTLVYNHHVRELAEKLTAHQHQHHHQVISTLHVHLDAHHCLEVLVLRGKGAEIRQLGHELIGVKGVAHGKLVLTAAPEA